MGRNSGITAFTKERHRGGDQPLTRIRVAFRATCSHRLPKLGGKGNHTSWATGVKRHQPLLQNSSIEEYTEMLQEKAAVKFLILVNIEEFNLKGLRERFQPLNPVLLSLESLSAKSELRF